MTDNHTHSLIAANYAVIYRRALEKHPKFIMQAINGQNARQQSMPLRQILRQEKSIKKIFIPAPASITLYFHLLHEAENALKTGLFRRKKPNFSLCKEKLMKAIEKLQHILKDEGFIDEIKRLVVLHQRLQ